MTTRDGSILVIIGHDNSTGTVLDLQLFINQKVLFAISRDPNNIPGTTGKLKKLKFHLLSRFLYSKPSRQVGARK